MTIDFRNVLRILHDQREIHDEMTAFLVSRILEENKSIYLTTWSKVRACLEELVTLGLVEKRKTVLDDHLYKLKASSSDIEKLLLL